MTAHRQSKTSTPVYGVATTRLEIELFIVGILLSIIPLPVIIGAATGFERHLALQVLRLRYEFAYAGICALMLVLFQHYKSAHRYVLFLSSLCVGLSFYVAGALLMYNNEPTFYRVNEVIKDENIVKYVSAASLLSWPLFVISFALGIALIWARKSVGVSTVEIVEEDREN